MGVEIKSVLHKHRPTVVIIHDGKHSEHKNAVGLIEGLKKRNIHNSEIISSISNLGEAISSFYSLHPRPAVMIVRQDMQAPYVWFGPNMPPIEEVAFRYTQIGA